MIETRKTMTSKNLSIKVVKGEQLSLDNSTQVDDFWNAIVDCIQNTYPSQNVNYDPVNNVIEVSLSEVVSFVFRKDSEKGVVSAVKMPYYLGDSARNLLIGKEEKVIYPLVNINDTWNYLIFKGEPSLRYDSTINDDYYPTIVLLALTMANTYLRVNITDLTLDIVNTIVGNEITKDYLISYGMMYGISLNPDSFPDNFGYVKIDSVALEKSRPVRLTLNSDSFNVEINGSVSFYDSGVVFNPILSVFVPGYNVLLDSERYTKPLEIKVDFSVYDTSDNLITTGSATIQTIYDLSFAVSYNESLNLFRFFGLIQQDKQEIIKVQSKVSTDTPVYRLERAPELVEEGRYVIVLNSDNYAYRIVKVIDNTDITLDSDLPFDITDDTYLFFTVPNNAVVDYPTVNSVKSSIRTATFTITSASLSTFKSSDVSSIFLMPIMSITFTPKSSDLDRSCLASFGMENTLSFYDYVGFLDSLMNKLEKNIYTSLPKYPIRDGAIEDSSYLDYLDYLDYHTFADFNDDTIETRTLIPYVIIEISQENDNNFDFVGVVPLVLVADEGIRELFPTKGFVNLTELMQVDSTAVVITNIYNDVAKKCSLFNAGFPITLDGKYFEVR